MELTIKNIVCMMCGEQITHEDRVLAHLIPKCLKPKDNVLIHLHKECEKKINKLYVNQQTKKYSEKIQKKALNILRDFKASIKLMEDRVKEDGK